MGSFLHQSNPGVVSRALVSATCWSPEDGSDIDWPLEILELQRTSSRKSRNKLANKCLFVSNLVADQT